MEHTEMSPEFAWDQLAGNGIKVDDIEHKHIKTLQHEDGYTMMLFQIKKEYKSILDAKHPSDSIMTVVGKELLPKTIPSCDPYKPYANETILDIYKLVGQELTQCNKQMIATKKFIDTSQMLNLSKWDGEIYKKFILDEYMNVPVKVT